MADRISIRAFAKLDGCAESLVRRGVKEGRLVTGPDGKLDPIFAGTGWRKGNAIGMRTKGAQGVRSAHPEQAGEIVGPFPTFERQGQFEPRCFPRYEVLKSGYNWLGYNSMGYTKRKF